MKTPSPEDRADIAARLMTAAYFLVLGGIWFLSKSIGLTMLAAGVGAGLVAYWTIKD